MIGVTLGVRYSTVLRYSNGRQGIGSLVWCSLPVPSLKAFILSESIMAEQKVRTSGLIQPGTATPGSRFSSTAGNLARPMPDATTVTEPQPSSSPKSDASRPIVVQCPSCRTKFALDASALSNIERPRFHCTKCDSTFTKSSASLMHIRPSADAPSLSIESPPQKSPSASSEHHAEALQEPGTSEAPGDAVGDITSWIPRESVDPDVATERAPERVPTNEDFQAFAARHRAHEEASREAGNHAATTTPAGTESTEAEIPAPSAPGRAPVVPASPSPIKPLTSSARPHASGLQTLQTSPKVFSGLSGMSRSVKPIPEAPGPKAAPWRNLMIAIAPLGITLVLAGLTTAYLLEKPHGLAAITPSLFSSAQHVAPPQLDIVTTSFRKLGLENGESILVISGKVSNKTDKTFQRVDIQGITFDSSGTPLQKQLAAAGSVLTKAHLSNLSSRIISELQAGSLHKNSPLKPGQTVDFVISIIQDTQASAAAPSSGDSNDELPSTGMPAFYGARVYSVR